MTEKHKAPTAASMATVDAGSPLTKRQQTPKADAGASKATSGTDCLATGSVPPLAVLVEHSRRPGSAAERWTGTWNTRSPNRCRLAGVLSGRAHARVTASAPRPRAERMATLVPPNMRRDAADSMSTSYGKILEVLPPSARSAPDDGRCFVEHHAHMSLGGRLKVACMHTYCTTHCRSLRRIKIQWHTWGRRARQPDPVS